MSVCGQTEEESASEEPGPTSREAYEQKAVSKVVRVLTVLAYLLSVSLAAILLSVYYVCVWKSPELPRVNGTGEGQLAARRAAPPLSHTYNDTHLPQFTGGGGVSVNDSLSQTTSANITDGPASSSSSHPSTEASEEDTGSPYSTATVQWTDDMRADNSSIT